MTNQFPKACTLEKLAEKERRAEEVRAKKASRVEEDGTEAKQEEAAYCQGLGMLTAFYISWRITHLQPHYFVKRVTINFEK